VFGVYNSVAVNNVILIVFGFVFFADLLCFRVLVLVFSGVWCLRDLRVCVELWLLLVSAGFTVAWDCVYLAVRGSVLLVFAMSLVWCGFVFDFGLGVMLGFCLF